MVPYRQGRSAAEDAFKLSSNENPFPPLPEVLAAITEKRFSISWQINVARLVSENG